MQRFWNKHMFRTLTFILPLSISMQLNSVYSNANTQSEPSVWSREAYRESRAFLGLHPVFNTAYDVDITREEFLLLVCGFMDACVAKQPARNASNSEYHAESIRSFESSRITIFEDSKDFSYHEELNSAMEYELIKGYPDKTFKPKNTISRQEIATILHKIMEKYSEAKVPSDRSFSFSDDADINSWARPAVEYCFAAGIMNGVAKNTIDPLRKTTREQAVTMLHNMFSRYFIPHFEANQQASSIIKDYDGKLKDSVAARIGNQGETGYGLVKSVIGSQHLEGLSDIFGESVRQSVYTAVDNMALDPTCANIILTGNSVDVYYKKPLPGRISLSRSVDDYAAKEYEHFMVTTEFPDNPYFLESAQSFLEVFQNGVSMTDMFRERMKLATPDTLSAYAYVSMPDAVPNISCFVNKNLNGSYTYVFTATRELGN